MKVIPLRNASCALNLLSTVLLQVRAKYVKFVCEIVVCPLVLYLVIIKLSVLLQFTASDNPFGILDLRLLITPLVS
jgi:hypothetical protein